MVRADVTDAAAMRSLQAEAEHLTGPADLLAVGAGGGGEPVALADLAPEQWRATIDLRLTSAFLTLRAFLPGMAQRGRGSVVTISSPGARVEGLQ